MGNPGDARRFTGAPGWPRCKAIKPNGEQCKLYCEPERAEIKRCHIHDPNGLWARQQDAKKRVHQDVLRPFVLYSLQCVNCGADGGCLESWFSRAHQGPGYDGRRGARDRLGIEEYHPYRADLNPTGSKNEWVGVSVYCSGCGCDMLLVLSSNAGSMWVGLERSELATADRLKHWGRWGSSTTETHLPAVDPPAWPDLDSDTPPF